MHRTALEIRRGLGQADNALVAESLDHAARVLMLENKLTEAEQMERESLAIRTKLFGEEHATVAVSMSGLADVIFRQGNRAEAEAVCRAALRMRRLPGSDASGLGDALENFGDILLARGKLPES